MVLQEVHRDQRLGWAGGDLSGLLRWWIRDECVLGLLREKWGGGDGLEEDGV